MLYWLPFLLSGGGVLAILLLFIRRKIFIRLGGVAVIAVFLSGIFLNPYLVVSRQLWGIVAGVLIILLLGVWDDFKNLSPAAQFAGQFLAAGTAVFSGVRIDYLTNPLGGAFHLDIFYLNYIFAFLWIIALMNIVNWLDGLDGLASGIGAIGFTVLFFLAVSPLVNQPPLGIIAISLAGIFGGFLVFNFPPAKIMLGTSGSYFLGYLLATLSIFAGGKIATTTLVMAIPALDALWVIIGRLKEGVSVFKGDKSHLHYRLASLGFSHRRILLLYCCLSGLAGMAALMAGTPGKIFLFGGLLIVSAGGIFFVRKNKR